MLKSFLYRDLKILLHHPLSFISRIITIIITILTLFYLSKYIDMNIQKSAELSAGYFPFVLSGIIITQLFMIFSNGIYMNLRNEILSGQFYLWVSINNTPLKSVIANSLFNNIQDFIKIVILTIFLFISLSNVSAIKIFVIIYLFGSIILFGLGIGIVSSGLTIRLRKGISLLWIITTCSNLLTGVYFPVSILPVYIRKISYLIPNTYIISIFRDVCINNTGLHDDIKLQLLLLTIIIFFFFSAAIYIFNRLVKNSRFRGLI